MQNLKWLGRGYWEDMLGRRTRYEDDMSQGRARTKQNMNSKG